MEAFSSRRGLYLPSRHVDRCSSAQALTRDFLSPFPTSLFYLVSRSLPLLSLLASNESVLCISYFMGFMWVLRNAWAPPR